MKLINQRNLILIVQMLRLIKEMKKQLNKDKAKELKKILITFINPISSILILKNLNKMIRIKKILMK